MKNIAINGFGRIGRCVARAYIERRAELNYRLSVINSRGLTPEDAGYFLSYDSTHGRLFDPIEVHDEEGCISLPKQDGDKISVTGVSTIEELDWKGLGVDIVMECSGNFNNRSELLKHIDGGAERVIVSAPCSNADMMMIWGVNDSSFSERYRLISAGSCTTNCLAPVVAAIQREFGITTGFVTTVHAYTNDQLLLDGRHKDRRRGRAAALSIIPTSTGAAKSIAEVFPELTGMLDGVALRVPTANVSLIDFKFTTKRSTTAQEINALFLYEHKSNPAVYGYNSEKLVSVDFNKSSESMIFDATQTTVLDGTFCRIMAWYDNEWGFSHRMLDICQHLAGLPRAA